MSEHRRRGVTRGYVGGLICAVLVVAFGLILAAWGGISLLADRGPISTPGVGFGVAALMVLLCLVVLAWGLWSQSLVLLRGRRSPSWPHVLTVMVGGYLVWCLAGTAAGLVFEDTWLSAYAATLALSWAIASLLYWAVLMRRVYTDRPTPRWPWEKEGDLGPDWAGTDDDPWREAGGDGLGDDPDGFDGDGSGGRDDRPHGGF